AVAGLRLATRARIGGAGPGPWTLAAADFTLRANSPGTWLDLAQLAVRRSGRVLHRADLVPAGTLLRARRPDQSAASAWLRVAADATLEQALPAQDQAHTWLWTDVDGQPVPAAGLPDPDQWLLDSVTVDLALRQPTGTTLRRDGCALAAGGGDVPWFEPDADAQFDAATDLASLAWPLAGAAPGLDGPDWMLVPAAVGAGFGPWQAAQLADGDALARMGLADYHADLFLDSAWRDDTGLRAAQLLRWADDIRFLSAQPRRLRGLHGALGRDDATARDATWIAVPDATHPGWRLTTPPPRADGQLIPVPDPVCSCADAAPAFDDCVQPPLRPQAPRFAQFKPQPQAPADVAWFIDALAPPSGTLAYEVQIARRADFSDAMPLGASVFLPAPARYTLRLAAGLVFLRARVWRDGLASAWSAPLDIHVLGATRVANTGPVDAAVLFPVHAALMDLCAATREHVALLALPQAWQALDVASHVGRLRARAAAGARAAQDTSFVALYHPWLLRREDGQLVAHPPEGSVLGVYARRSRERGAWAAAGLDPLADAVALAKPLDPGAIEQAGANAIEQRTRGFAATRAWTLSDDSDWQALGVRRLFILLRRLARREGERYAFEPNDTTLRRSLERSFDALLQRLMQGGAFRGSRTPDCYLLRTAASGQVQDEIERGECSLEIQVAPSRPLRFLTLRVVRAGEQLLLEEY
ncbi:phage tail sheath C-terminal domain-containing protein, partial [Massilia sp. S19_KUP03_FR1]|uniref:phage tail sheath C-terminal domain-containing protein n=1 Tax=Massilia sp. S19_KUP03_FR1 TaxID=3025503 RepID=UPI002FCDC763